MIITKLYRAIKNYKCLISQGVQVTLLQLPSFYDASLDELIIVFGNIDQYLVNRDEKTLVKKKLQSFKFYKKKLPKPLLEIVRKTQKTIDKKPPNLEKIKEKNRKVVDTTREIVRQKLNPFMKKISQCLKRKN